MLRPQWRLIFDVSWKTWTDIMLNEIIFNALNHLKCKVEQMVYINLFVMKDNKFFLRYLLLSYQCFLFMHIIYKFTYIFIYITLLFKIWTHASWWSIYYDTVAITCCFGVNNKIRQTHKNYYYLLPFMCTPFLHIDLAAIIWPKYIADRRKTLYN